MSSPKLVTIREPIVPSEDISPQVSENENEVMPLNLININYQFKRFRERNSSKHSSSRASSYEEENEGYEEQENQEKEYGNERRRFEKKNIDV